MRQTGASARRPPRRSARGALRVLRGDRLLRDPQGGEGRSPTAWEIDLRRAGCPVTARSVLSKALAGPVIHGGSGRSYARNPRSVMTRFASARRLRALASGPANGDGGFTNRTPTGPDRVPHLPPSLDCLRPTGRDSSLSYRSHAGNGGSRPARSLLLVAPTSASPTAPLLDALGHRPVGVPIRHPRLDRGGCQRLRGKSRRCTGHRPTTPPAGPSRRFTPTTRSAPGSRDRPQGRRNAVRHELRPAERLLEPSWKV